MNIEHATWIAVHAKADGPQVLHFNYDPEEIIEALDTLRKASETRGKKIEKWRSRFRRAAGFLGPR